MNADVLDCFGSERVRHFTDAEMPGERELPHNVRWQDYHSVRNSVLDALRHFGTVGAMGKATITDGDEGAPGPWPVETLEPDFLVVDDMWNNWDRRVSVEVEQPQLVTLPVLHALREMIARDHPDWGVGVATEDGYILVTASEVLVKGSAYDSCETIRDVAASS
jgi:hypothetical protein